MIRWFILLAVIATAAAAGNAPVIVGNFSKGDLGGWERKHFSGETSYQIVTYDGHQVLQAHSRVAATSLYKRVRIDLEKTPYINWSWNVDHTLASLDEKTRAGDDYAARVYVVFSGKHSLSSSQAVNYVWSGSQPQGTEWLNAYSHNFRMIAVRSGNQQAGIWVKEKRNVREDYQRLFGDDARYANVIAIMTDTDNSGKEVSAYYGDIYFTEY